MTSLPELMALYSAYSVAIDALDGDSLVSCFSEDAQIQSPVRVVNGHEEIREWMLLSRPGLLHQYSNLLILEQSATKIVSRADWTVHEAGEVISTGTYRDEVRREADGDLRLSKREIVYTWRRVAPSA